MRGKPRIHENFDIREPSQLSPPIVMSPVRECAGAVHVYGFVPQAEVHVYAGTTELIGHAAPEYGFADILLDRALSAGEVVSATQTVNGITSLQSIYPVRVTDWTSEGRTLRKPEVHQDIYECGRVVLVSDLLESVVVRVFADGARVGEAESPSTYNAVWTQPLAANQSVTAVQVACGDLPDRMIMSPPSDPVNVKAEPSPIPAPIIDPNTLIAGNDTVTLYDLLVGAKLGVYDSGNQIGNGWATGSSNWTRVSPPLATGSSITGDQTLCGGPGAESTPVTPEGSLPAPVVLEPICAGARYAVVRDTVISSTVVVERNAAIAGYAGAVAGDLMVAIGGAALSAGDSIRAHQYMGSTLSPTSNTVAVTPGLATPALELGGGHWFFDAEEGEDPIDGPVFLRGRGAGPLIQIQSCCEKGARAVIRGPGGEDVAEVELRELFPGYFEGRWDWTSRREWSVPDGIPVGPYDVLVTTGCDQIPAVARFYVIFDPAGVGGPSRFSFNEIGVWFGMSKNSSVARVYHLHPDDGRVFGPAISAASGQTRPFDAAQKIRDAEAAVFGYSLAYHTDDVVDMIANYQDAQCADDANVLTAMLRAVGIPAHPVTADAALETGDASWTFDTWTEFLAATSGKPNWWILHPHEYPNMSPEDRATFGANRGVATKDFNDLTIMAGKDWLWSEATDTSPDVEYDRNICHEPKNDDVYRAAWLLHLCEDGYWNPNHWDCAGGGGGCMALSFAGPSGRRSDLELASRELSPGERMRGVFVFRAGPEDELEEHLALELVSDLPESKQFPDEVLARVAQARASRPGEEVRIEFDADVPTRLRAGHDLYLALRSGKRYLASQLIEVVQWVGLELRGPGEARVGAAIDLRARIVNRGPRVLTEVRGALSLPPGLQVDEKSAELRVDAMKPGESRELHWRLRALAPLEAGSITLSIDTADGGGARVSSPIRILGDRDRGVDRGTAMPPQSSE